MREFTAILLIAAGMVFHGRTEMFQFDDLRTGEVPTGWLGALTGKGEPKWSAVSDDSAPSQPNVLKQSGEATYALFIKTNAMLKNGYVQVKFKAVSGKEDQAGGVLWRVKDANDYYVCRANALENNVVAYKTVAGKRFSLDIVGRKGGYGVEEKVAHGEWHTLRVEFASNRCQVFFNGKHLFDVQDDTFREAGHVGLWTKADSVTLFDDFEYGDK